MIRNMKSVEYRNDRKPMGKKVHFSDKISHPKNWIQQNYMDLILLEKNERDKTGYPEMFTSFGF